MGVRTVVTLESLRRDKKAEILRLAEMHGCRNVRIFGSVATGENRGAPPEPRVGGSENTSAASSFSTKTCYTDLAGFKGAGGCVTELGEPCSWVGVGL
jgi:hypothetical protein